ncbi:MAG: sigma-54 dependent transcriptional regulator, partial [Planctomycetota bacterium]
MTETTLPRRRTTARRILIVDDEKLIRWSLKERFQQDGFEVEEAENGQAALEGFASGDFALAVLDFRLPDMNGLELLERLKAVDPELGVIFMTAYGTVQNAVDAMKLGAQDYVIKPFDIDGMALTVRKTLDTADLLQEVNAFREQNKRRFGMHNIVYRSRLMGEIVELVRRVAESEAQTILIQGESGTGKGLVARALHYESPKAERPFMNITCTALAETIMESELFGHEKGAFTDAKQQKKGLFELANGGTVFLDEISDMPLNLQGKLLRFLEDRSFKRVGGTRDITVDVRIVAATNKDLGRAVDEGSFRGDLFYRLKVIPIDIPPLRDRRADVPALIEHFVDSFNRDFKKNVVGFVPDAFSILQSYHWPGNIRELRNTVERAVLLSVGDRLDEDDTVVGQVQQPGASGLGG